MTRPPIFRDHRSDPPESGWRLDPGTVGMLVLVTAIIAFVFAAFALGCSQQHAKSAADVNACMAKADAAAIARNAQTCKSETFAACPEHDALEAQHEKELRECRP